MVERNKEIEPQKTKLRICNSKLIWTPGQIHNEDSFFIYDGGERSLRMRPDMEELAKRLVEYGLPLNGKQYKADEVEMFFEKDCDHAVYYLGGYFGRDPLPASDYIFSDFTEEQIKELKDSIDRLKNGGELKEKNQFKPERKIMQRAIEIAKENFEKNGFAVGAIIVQDDQILAEATTTLNKDQDPTAHAEINVIRETAKKLGTRYLENTYLYTTFEPCPMCASAAVWAKMKGIIYGASREDQTKSHPWRVMVSAEEIIKNGTPKLELYPKFMREECRELLSLSKY
jgi:tRNA(Arg) A34 adenosine deaminase TadA